MSKVLEKLPEVSRRTSLSRSMIYLLMSRGQFPQSVKLSERAVAWDSEEIDKWISERAKQSRTA